MSFNFFKKLIIARCGHSVKHKTKVVVMGKKDKFTVEDKNATIDFCPECTAKMAIRCVKCGEIILPGDPITLYELDKIGSEYSSYATVSNGSVIGCVSTGCSEFVFFVGYWVAPGKVRLLKVTNDSDGFVCLE
jgi:hypothetical protein